MLTRDILCGICNEFVNGNVYEYMHVYSTAIGEEMEITP
jgi:hypothetical protein